MKDPLRIIEILDLLGTHWTKEENINKSFGELIVEIEQELQKDLFLSLVCYTDEELIEYLKNKK